MDLVFLLWAIPLFAIVVVTIGLTVYLLFPLPFPFATESDYTYHRSPWWQLYYSHKYLRPKRRAEKNSGLEAAFRGMDFHFDTAHLKDTRTFTLCATGDLMCRKDLVGPGGASLFEDVGEDIFSADLTLGNLEFAVNPHVYYHKLLRFSVPPHYATPLLRAENRGRFDAVSLANNHINDSFHQGIVETCNFLDAVGIAHTGANRTASEQDRILMLERAGVKIAILSYTFSTNGLPLEQDRTFGTNVIRFNALKETDYDPSLILRHIALAKNQGADYIISCHHWGIDLELYPPLRMVKRARALLDAGVDLIVGHHPHVLGPVERYRTTDGRDALIFYSLGNFTAKGLPFPIQRLGAIAKVALTVGTDAAGQRVVTPEGVEIIPTLFNMKKVDGVPRGFVRKVKPWAARIEKKERALGLNFQETLELTYAARAFRKYFESDTNGIVYR